jgi:hypothetical protein
MHELGSELGLLGLEQAPTLGGVTDAKRHAFAAVSDWIAMRGLEQR